MKTVKKTLLRLLIAVSAAVGIVAAFWAALYGVLVLLFWNSDQKYLIPREIDVNTNGEYSVKLYALSAPEWPFGPQYGLVALYNDFTVICGKEFRLRNDGKYMDSWNWDVEWFDDRAEVTITAEEQEDEIIYLCCDGSVEREE